VFGKILVACWVFFWGFVLLLVVFPQMIARIPHVELLRLFLIALVLISAIYGVSWLYRRGMKVAGK
jgi:hypothetical protein